MRDCPNYSSLEIGQNPEKNTEKNPGDLRRHAVNQASEKDHHLIQMWKTLKESNNTNSLHYLRFTSVFAFNAILKDMNQFLLPPPLGKEWDRLDSLFIKAIIPGEGNTEGPYAKKSNYTENENMKVK